MSGNVKFNGWINDDGSENYKCRAWVNFNGTGTVAIRASGNVSSITDNGTGDYTVNFNTAMPDANYCATASVHFFAPGAVAGNDIINISANAVGNARLVNYESGARRDPAQLFAAIFR